MYLIPSNANAQKKINPSMVIFRKNRPLNGIIDLVKQLP